MQKISEIFSVVFFFNKEAVCGALEQSYHNISSLPLSLSLYLSIYLSIYLTYNLYYLMSYRILLLRNWFLNRYSGLLLITIPFLFIGFLRAAISRLSRIII